MLIEERTHDQSAYSDAQCGAAGADCHRSLIPKALCFLLPCPSWGGYMIMATFPSMVGSSGSLDVPYFLRNSIFSFSLSAGVLDCVSGMPDILSQLEVLELTCQMVERSAGVWVGSSEPAELEGVAFSLVSAPPSVVTCGSCGQHASGLWLLRLMSAAHRFRDRLDALIRLFM